MICLVLKCGFIMWFCIVVLFEVLLFCYFISLDCFDIWLRSIYFKVVDFIFGVALLVELLYQFLSF